MDTWEKSVKMLVKYFKIFKIQCNFLTHALLSIHVLETYSDFLNFIPVCKSLRSFEFGTRLPTVHHWSKLETRLVSGNTDVNTSLACHNAITWQMGDNKLIQYTARLQSAS